MAIPVSWSQSDWTPLGWVGKEIEKTWNLSQKCLRIGTCFARGMVWNSSNKLIESMPRNALLIMGGQHGIDLFVCNFDDQQ